MSDSAPEASASPTDTQMAVIAGIEARLSRLESLLEGIPALVATLTDSLDSWSQKRAPEMAEGLTERLEKLEKLMLSVTAPHRLAALEHAITQADSLLPYLSMVGELPALIATGVDSADHLYQRFTESHPHLLQLRGDLQEMLSPAALHTLSAMAKALSASKEAEPAKLSALLGAWNDPHIRQTLGFGLAFAQYFGEFSHAE